MTERPTGLPVGRDVFEPNDNPWGPNDRGQNPPQWVPINKVRRSIDGVEVSGG